MNQRRGTRLHAILMLVASCLMLLGVASLLAQEPPKPAPIKPGETAGQHFKNIQLLKDIPAEQLIPTMQFMAASLGVECEFCHVEHAMDKDDKDNKKFAREMIKMVLTLNKEHFDGELEVTCYTCHRGAAQPVGTPVLSADAGHAPMHVHGDAPDASLPKPEAVLDKYVAAVGGADALAKINTRIQRGTINAFGHVTPIVIFSEAPEKRVSVTQQPNGPSVTAFNGEAGWLAMPDSMHRMTTAEAEAARIDAQLRFPTRIRELYKEFHARPGEEINGRPTVLVSAKEEGGHPALRLYFDPETGLLVRLIRYAETPLGRLPTQVDYADYRTVNGVKMPFKWTLARPTGAFTVQLDSTELNTPIDEKIFVMPAEPAHP